MARTLCLLLLILPLLALAQTQWKWRDAQGRVQYSDRPPPAGTADKDILARPPGAQQSRVIQVLPVGQAPSAPAQRRLIERTLAVGGADPSDIDLIEGHGTGTLGDPLELTALAQTYGAARTAEPAWVGSVKSNMGHAQAAAGILGLVKVLQCGRRGVIAPTRYGDDPTDKIDWDSAGLALPTSAVPWAARSGSRWAAVSSFGVSGTNAHAILEMPDSINEHPADDRPEVAHA